MGSQRVMRVCLVLVGLLFAVASAELLKVSSTAMEQVEQCPQNSCCTMTGAVVRSCPLSGGSCCGESGYCCPSNYQCGASLMQQPSCVLKSGPISVPTQTRSVVYVGGTKTMLHSDDLARAVENDFFQRPTYVQPPPPQMYKLTVQPAPPPPPPSIHTTTFLPASQSSNGRCQPPHCLNVVPSTAASAGSSAASLSSSGLNAHGFGGLGSSSASQSSDSHQSSGSSSSLSASEASMNKRSEVLYDECSGVVVNLECTKRPVVKKHDDDEHGSSSSVSQSLKSLSALSSSLASASGESSGNPAFEHQLHDIAHSITNIIKNLEKGEALANVGDGSESVSALRSSLSKSASSLSSALSSISSLSSSSKSHHSGSSALARSLASVSSVLSSLSKSGALGSALSHSSHSSSESGSHHSSGSSHASSSLSSLMSSLSKAGSSHHSGMSRSVNSMPSDSLLSAVSEALSGSMRHHSSSGSSHSKSGLESSESSHHAEESSLLSALSHSDAAKHPRRLLIKLLHTVITQLEDAAAMAGGHGHHESSSSTSSLSSVIDSLSSSLSEHRLKGLKRALNARDGAAMTFNVQVLDKEEHDATQKADAKEAVKMARRAAAVNKLKLVVNELGKRIPTLSNMQPMNPPQAGWVKPIDPTNYWKWEEPYSTLPVKRMQRCGPWPCNEWMRPDLLLTNAPRRFKKGPKMHFEVPIHVAINRPLLMTKTTTDMHLKSGKHVKAVTRTFHHIPVRTVTTTKIPQRPAPVVEYKVLPALPDVVSTESVAPPPFPASPLAQAQASQAAPPPPPPPPPMPKAKAAPVKPAPKSKTKVNQHVELNIGRPILEDV